MKQEFILLLAIGSERYTPYNPTKKPPDINDVKAFFIHLLERVDWNRDLHFLTKTTIDTLDYSSKKLNEGSKLIVAAEKGWS